MNTDHHALRLLYRALLLFLALALSTALAGCELFFLLEESAQQQAADAAQEWVEVNDLNPVNEDGSLDPEGAANLARRLVTNSTGNPEVDAALNSDSAILKITEADKQIDQGWKEDDPRKFDNAVKLRPEDWKYRIARAAWNLDFYAAPNMSKVDADFIAAERLLGPDKNERIAYAQYGIQQMEAVKTVMARPYAQGEQAPLFSRPHDCQTVFSRLSHFYTVLADQTGDQGAYAVAAQYTQDLAQCAP